MRIAAMILILSVIGLGCARKSRHSSLRDSGASSLTYERQADALRRVKELNATYGKVRDQILLGEGGITQLSQTINEETLAWSQEWKTIYQFIDASTRLSPSEVQNKVAINLINQTERIAKISNLRSRMSRLIESGRRQLASAPRVSYAIIGFEAQYSALETSIDRLDATLKRIYDEGQTMNNRLETTSPRIHHALVQRLKANLLSNGSDNLEKSIAAVEAMFAAERVVAPIETRLREKYLSTMKYFLAGRIFRLDLELVELKKQCSESEINVAALPIDSSYKQDAVRRIRATCDEASGKGEYLHSNNISIPRLVAGAHQRRLKNASITCSSSTPQAFNCKMLPWLSQVTTEKVEAMPDQQLRNLELAWDVLEVDTKGDEF